MNTRLSWLVSYFKGTWRINRDALGFSGVLLPTLSPNIQPVCSLVAPEISSLYDKLMSEILEQDESDVLNRALMLTEASKRLELRLANVDQFEGHGTELWLQGVDLGLTTSNPEVIKKFMDDELLDLVPEEAPDTLGFHIPSGDGVQCFFESFAIGPVSDPTSDYPEATIPYALGIRAVNALFHSADDNVPPCFIPGLSTIVPAKFEDLQIGIVVK